MATNAWKTHDWSLRPLEIKGEKFTMAVCRECSRSFVDDTSGERYAIYIGVFAIHRLSDHVTARWLSEHCPTKRLETDDAADRHSLHSRNGTH